MSTQNANKKFLELQDLFYGGSSGALDEMWLIVYDLAGTLLITEFKKKKLYRNDFEDLKNQICVNFMRRYKNIAGYRVKRSVVSCVYDVMRNVLYHPTKAEKNTVFVDVESAVLGRKHKAPEKAEIETNIKGALNKIEALKKTMSEEYKIMKDMLIQTEEALLDELQKLTDDSLFTSEDGNLDAELIKAECDKANTVCNLAARICEVHETKNNENRLKLDIVHEMNGMNADPTYEKFLGIEHEK